jgi:hypothetical protein
MGRVVELPEVGGLHHGHVREGASIVRVDGISVSTSGLWDSMCRFFTQVTTLPVVAWAWACRTKRNTKVLPFANCSIILRWWTRVAMTAGLRCRLAACWP